MSIKPLYEFTLPREHEITEEEVTDQGTLHKKVKTIIQLPMCLKKPSRRELEEIDMQYARNFSQCLRDGIFTKAQITKNYASTGGLLTEAERKAYDTLYEDYNTSQLKLQAANLEVQKAQADGLTPAEVGEKKDKLVEAQAKFWELHLTIQEFENEQSHLFAQTAEVIARNKTLIWVTVNLSFMRELEEDESFSEWVPVFKGQTYEDKLDYYDSIVEEGNDFLTVAVERLALIAGFWYTGGATTQEEYEWLDETISKLNDNMLEGLKQAATAKAEKEQTEKDAKTEQGEPKKKAAKKKSPAKKAPAKKDVA